MTTGNAAALVPYTFTITYADNVAVAKASLAEAVVLVQFPGGGLAVRDTELSITRSGSPRTLRATRRLRRSPTRSRRRGEVGPRVPTGSRTTRSRSS